jgi:hypothetical protein
LRSFLRNIFHYLQRAFVQKRAHLLDEFMPSAGGIVAENHADNRLKRG